MNISEFLKQHGLTCRTPEEEEFMLQALDKMYIEMRTEDAVRMVMDYMDNADEIFNATNAEQEKVLAKDEEK
jgi:hypothetical protein